IESNPTWTKDEIQDELDNNAQTMLGYVVRCVEQVVGTSKVPDIQDAGLMEDRARLRITSQMMASWLHHEICTVAQVEDTLQRMADIVDKQNEGDETYVKIAPDVDNSVAFQAARELVFDGHLQPNDYTEPILHRRRIEAKKKQNVK